ncbi:nucleoside-diphosphate kinase [Candidatus Vampirococcus lugosii]|uniref:Nucleoside diphosphate kinase n=1 Tax=Candidatus Vampirococcus lugosii TaxID=2789015 RepID=A0ABS5QJX6_9BACT|nr:nucleoside diphosphate kinase [Candidatus Vampirococcus lugosii]
MSERTLIILKPDTVTRGLLGKVISRFEEKGLKLVGCKMIELNNEVLEKHYDHLKDKPFFPSIVSYMTSSPVLVQAWEGVEAVDVVRLMIGVTNSRQAQPGTVRGDFAMSIGRNIVHASEDIDAAKVELERFFDQNELYSYTRADEDKIYEDDEK